MMTYRIGLLAILLLSGLLHAQELFTSAAPLPLPFPPGERSVARLLPVGHTLYGVVIGGKSARFFSLDPAAGALKEETPPFPIAPALAELLSHAAQPLVLDVPNRCAYTLNDAGKLVKVDILGKMTELGQVSGTRPFEDKTGFQHSRAIAQGPDGALYTAGAQGAIFRYTPATQKLDKLAAALPAVKGREAWASLDAAAFGPDGLLYGGTFDGYLFTFDPKTLAVVNLGKPFREQRIQGLAFRQGRLIGVGGDEDGIPRAFAFDPATRGFTLGGPLPGGVVPNNYEPVGAMVAAPDGTIYYGTTGRMANVFVWKP